MNEMKVFARLDDAGNIVEYPVYDAHIRSRKHPYEWYSECKFSEKPMVTKFNIVKEVFQINVSKVNNFVKRTVNVTYEVVPQDINNIFTSYCFDTNGQPKTISEIDSDVVEKIIELSDQYVESKLDAFAQTRGYKNAERCAGYKDSTIPKFATEAARVIELRDQVWIKIPEYMTKVLTGVKPMVKSTADIDAELPEFVW